MNRTVLFTIMTVAFIVSLFFVLAVVAAVESSDNQVAPNNQKEQFCRLKGYDGYFGLIEAWLDKGDAIACYINLANHTRIDYIWMPKNTSETIYKTTS